MSVAKELEHIRRMPYGTARTAAAENISRRIEADGPREKLPEALLDLVEAYTFAGDGAKSFVPFARLLRLWDEAPELFDVSDQHNLFWEFKWVASDLSDFPQINVQQAEAFLDDMQRRYELQGLGLSAVRAARFGWAWHSGIGDAEAARIAWVATTRDNFDDCRACTIGVQTDYFVDQGRFAEALELGKTQDSSCNIEPTKTYFASALAALNLGEAAEALRLHGLAVATVGSDNRQIGQSRGQSFEMLARGGQLERALRELRSDYRGLLTDPPSPLLHFRFLQGVLAGLSANLDRGELGIGMPLPGANGAGEASVADLHAWVAAELHTLAAAFDRRAGNDTYARLETAALSAELAPVPLPTAEIAADRGAAPATASAAAAGSVREALASGETRVDSGIAAPAHEASSVDSVEELLARGEALTAAREYADAAAAFAAVVPELEQAGWIERAGIAAAEGAQCAALAGNEELAHALFGKSVPLLRAGGTDTATVAAVLGAWAPIASHMGDPAAQLAATEAVLSGHGEFNGVDLADDLAERLRGEWLLQRAQLRDTLARSIAAALSLGGVTYLGENLDRPRAVSEALLAGEEFAQAGHIIDAAHAFWLAGKVQRELGDTEAAVWAFESAFEGFTMASRPDDRVRVADELIELFNATGQAERAEQLIAQL